MDQNSRLVYSSSPALNRKCPKCKEAVSECVCAPEAAVRSGGITAVLRIEKSGRNGKTVTVIDRLPKSENLLKALCTELKKKCGSGGTYVLSGADGVIEIQGDKREMIRGVLSKKGMTVKG
ncbi:MAG TPA: stress response translation initiation inhibitor YciH [bacterium]|nr:stress response translation initiation inhibitor YciH [bacterium]